MTRSLRRNGRRISGHREVHSQWNCDVLAVDEDVGQRLQTCNPDVVPPGADHGSNVADQLVDRPTRSVLRCEADHPVHPSQVARMLDHRQKRFTQSDLLQSQMGSYVPDAPAAAERRVLPLLLGYVFEQFGYVPAGGRWRPRLRRRSKHLLEVVEREASREGRYPRCGL
jgi:hypothetical protein